MPTPFPVGRRISDADALRAAQAPLKDRHREDPSATAVDGTDACSGDLLLQALLA